MKRIGAALLIALVLIATGCTQYQYIPVPPGIFDNWEDDNEVVELVITETVTVGVNGTVPATVAAIATYEDGTSEEVDAEIISYVNTANVGVHSAFAAYENKMVDIDVYVYAAEDAINDKGDINTVMTGLTDGDIISVNSNFTFTDDDSALFAVPGDKSNITILGNGAKVTVESKDASLFDIDGTDVIIDGFNFDFTTPESEALNMNLLTIQGTNVTVRNCTFTGLYTQTGDGGHVTRGIEVSGSATVTIENCEFRGVRQPAYVNTGAHITINNNVIENTRGWNILADAVIDEMKGNSFEGWNAEDICLNKDAVENTYDETECIQLSLDNNGCRVTNQEADFKVQNGKIVEEYV